MVPARVTGAGALGSPALVTPGIRPGGTLDGRKEIVDLHARAAVRL